MGGEWCFPGRQTKGSGSPQDALRSFRCVGGVSAGPEGGAGAGWAGMP